MAERRGTANGEDAYVAWSRATEESETLGARFGGSFLRYTIGGTLLGTAFGALSEMQDGSFDGIGTIVSDAGIGLLVGGVAKMLLYLGYMEGSRRTARSIYLGSA